MESEIPNVKSEESKMLDKQIVALMEDGLTAKVIAERLGMSYHKINHRKRKLMHDGEIVGGHYERTLRRNMDSKLSYLKGKHRVKLGTFGIMARLLTDDELEWLYSETPAGCLVCETIAGFVRDAYADEVMK